MQKETKEIIQNLQEELTTRQDLYDELLAKYQDQSKVTLRIFKILKFIYLRLLGS